MYKDDHDKMVGFGFGNYHETLRAMCKFYSSASIKRINRFISIGFNNYRNISNINKMNLPTLDYMMSGYFVLDKKKFVEDISFNNINDEYPNINSTMFKSKLENLTDDQFRIMLKNWSGSYVIIPNRSYTIDTHNIDERSILKIQTCINTIYINSKLESIDLDSIIANLIDPINSMRG